ncbi:MAG TPA: preprotein translocase subunit YajC [Actinomycetota bacterium]
MLGSISPLLAASSSSGSAFTSLIFIGFMVVIFYMVLIRPQRRRQQAQRQLIESLDVGDEVVTLGGMYGTIRTLDDESITLEVAPGVDIRFARGAVARKLVYDDEEDYADEPSADDEPDSDHEEARRQEPEGRSRSGPWFRGRKGPNEGAGEQS